MSNLSVHRPVTPRAKGARSTSPFAGQDVPAFFFAGPTKTVVAADDESDAIEGTLRDPEPWLTRVDRALADAGRDGGRHGFVVGALPFSEGGAVRLFHSPRASALGAWRPEVAPSAARAAAAGETPPYDPAFVAAVEDATRAIGRGELSKVVLARARDVALGRRLDVRALLEVLRARNPHGFTYALSLGRPSTAHAEEPVRLVGASPELLLSRRGSTILSVPLAGSIPRASDPREDRERAAQLLRSAKDRHEHVLVVDHVVECLRPLTRSLRFEREPIVTATPTMWHLSTRIEGTLRDRDISSLRAAVALHPTPAVCGLPTREARAMIQRVEGFDRGYFTGTLGYVAGNGDGDWIVTIRCAEIAGDRARVFAGAGIVGSSEPERELAETDAKMSTVLSALFGRLT